MARPPAAPDRETVERRLEASRAGLEDVVAERDREGATDEEREKAATLVTHYENVITEFEAHLKRLPPKPEPPKRTLDEEGEAARKVLEGDMKRAKEGFKKANEAGNVEEVAYFNRQQKSIQAQLDAVGVGNR